MKKLKVVFLILFVAFLNSSHAQSEEVTQVESELEKMMVRIAEIEIHPEYLEEYIAILKLEAEASVRLEAGVICIY
ncbi:MAG: antibiotic biosynthesis monooxygenase, partial [Flavobacteriaceae bacterium]